jgi:antitoxin ChpS
MRLDQRELAGQARSKARSRATDCTEPLSRRASRTSPTDELVRVLGLDGVGRELVGSQPERSRAVQKARSVVRPAPVAYVVSACLDVVFWPGFEAAARVATSVYTLLMTYELKIRQVGNSASVTLSKEVLAALGHNVGDSLYLVPDGRGGASLLPHDPELLQQLDVATQVMDDDRTVLAVLATK